MNNETWLDRLDMKTFQIASMLAMLLITVIGAIIFAQSDSKLFGFVSIFAAFFCGMNFLMVFMVGGSNGIFEGSAYLSYTLKEYHTIIFTIGGVATLFFTVMALNLTVIETSPYIIFGVIALFLTPNIVLFFVNLKTMLVSEDPPDLKQQTLSEALG